MKNEIRIFTKKELAPLITIAKSQDAKESLRCIAFYRNHMTVTDAFVLYEREYAPIEGVFADDDTPVLVPVLALASMKSFTLTKEGAREVEEGITASYAEGPYPRYEILFKESTNELSWSGKIDPEYFSNLLKCFHGPVSIDLHLRTIITGQGDTKERGIIVGLLR